MRVSAVIGASFGDEGKGRTVHYLADDRSLVVRHNGGAQAGHTVVSYDGHRHVFHHFGSGTFRGAATFLSKYFISNPMTFCTELEALKRKGFQRGKKLVFVDPRSLVTTPWDMLINQALERKRGMVRHGSCGMAIHETQKRNETIQLTVDDILRTEPHVWIKKVQTIIEEWMPKRVKDLGLDDEVLKLTASKKLFEQFFNDCMKFGRNVSVRLVDNLLLRYEGWNHIIFEGAQGLKLDQDDPGFPYITHSKTGLFNAVDILAEADWQPAVDVYYVTRTYLTRHGPGPMPNETSEKPFPEIVDKTNIPNEWQGTLRFGLLDVDMLRASIAKDLKDAQSLKVTPKVVVTCADQVPAKDARWYQGQELKTGDIGDLLLNIWPDPNRVLAAFGPKAEDLLTLRSTLKSMRSKSA